MRLAESAAATKGSLAQHQRSVHEGKKYPCRECDHQATSKSDLNKHQRAIHEGKKYPCRACDNFFLILCCRGSCRFYFKLLHNLTATLLRGPILVRVTAQFCSNMLELLHAESRRQNCGEGRGSPLLMQINEMHKNKNNKTKGLKAWEPKIVAWEPV